MNQKCDGSFEVSVSKVIAATTPALVKALSDAKQRKALERRSADAGLVKALEAGFKDPKSKGFVTKPDGQARFRYKWDGMTVQFNLYPKGPGKTSIVRRSRHCPAPKPSSRIARCGKRLSPRLQTTVSDGRLQSELALWAKFTEA